MSGLFGALDITEIKTIPEDGTHTFELVSTAPFHSQAGNDFLKFNFRLIDDNSPLKGFEVTKWIRYYSDLTKEDFDDLSVPEQRVVINNLTRYKDWLTALKVPEHTFNDPDLSVLTGLQGDGYGFSKDGYNGGPKKWEMFSFKPFS